jgi:hypothetical protein
MIYGTFLQSPPLVLGRQKISCFRILMFQGSSGLNLIGDFYSINIFRREAPGEVVAHEKSHEVQTGMGGAAYSHMALERRLVSVFLCTPSF